MLLQNVSSPNINDLCPHDTVYHHCRHSRLPFDQQHHLQCDDGKCLLHAALHDRPDPSRGTKHRSCKLGTEQLELVLRCMCGVQRMRSSFMGDVLGRESKLGIRLLFEEWDWRGDSGNIE